MSAKTKKIISAVFATLVSLVTLAVTMEVIPQAHEKIALYIVAALGVIGTTLLPAVIGAPPTTFEVPALAKPAKDSKSKSSKPKGSNESHE